MSDVRKKMLKKYRKKSLKKLLGIRNNESCYHPAIDDVIYEKLKSLKKKLKSLKK